MNPFDKDFLDKIAKDMQVDDTELEKELARDSATIQGYINILYNDKLKELEDAQIELDRVYGASYYKHRELNELVLQPSEVKNYVVKDPDYIKAKENLNKVNREYNYLDKTIDNFKNRSFKLGNILEWRNYIQRGGNGA